MKRKFILIISLIVTALLLNACNMPGAPAGQIGPQAWVDAPLPASTVPLAPLDVVSHASDSGGIAQFELSIDGAVLRTDPSPDTTSSLVTIHQAWQPPGPGTYVIGVRGMNNGGTWSGPISVTVIVMGGPNAGPVPVDTVTPVTPNITPTPAVPTFTLIQNAFCRKGPDVSFPDVTAIPLGDTVDIQGVSEDGFWYFVFWKKFEARCWVAAHAGQPTGNLISVPVLASPPTAAPSASPSTSGPTATPVIIKP
jgi:hypothetical protein